MDLAKARNCMGLTWLKSSFRFGMAFEMAFGFSKSFLSAVECFNNS